MKTLRVLLCAFPVLLPTLADASCSVTGTFLTSHCDTDYVGYTTDAGTSVLTVTDQTTTSVELKPGDASTGAYDQTIALTGATVLNRADYSGVIMQTDKAQRDATVTAEDTVSITSVGGFGGIWVRNDVSGLISISSAATVSSTDTDGVTGSTNYGPVTVSNSGHVTIIKSGTVANTTYRGLYADGGYNNPDTDAVTVSIVNQSQGVVESIDAGARAINYQGLASIDNSGSVASTTRQGVIAWSNNGPVNISNSGSISSGDDHAVQAATEIGDIVVTNSGLLVSQDDPSINVVRSGYAAIYAEVDMDPIATGSQGKVSVTNTATGDIQAPADYGIVAHTPSGNIEVGNAGTIEALSGIEATASDGSVTLTNSNSITSSGGSGIGLHVLAASSGSIRNSGTVSGFDQALVTDAGSTLTDVENLSGGLIDGQVLMQGVGALLNAGTIVLASGVTSAVAGDYTQQYAGVSGALRVKVAGSSSYGALTVGGVASLPGGATITVVTGDAASCVGITAGTVLTGVVSGSSVIATGVSVSDDCDGLDFSAVVSGNSLNLVAVVNGACGSAAGVASAFAPTSGLCTLGSASVVSDSDPWSWSCSGSSGGSTAQCTAPNATTGSASGDARATVSGNSWIVDEANSAGFIAASGDPKSPPTLPAGYSFPHGLFDLKLINGDAGTAATVVITYPASLPAGTVWWKYGKTADNETRHWYIFPGAVIQGATVTLTLVDGASGDDDLSQNSAIVDPGGPGVLSDPAAIPALSWHAQWLLAGLLVLCAMGGPLLTHRRRH